MHLELFAEVPAGWRDAALGERWATFRDLRRVVTGAIELERARNGWARACRRRSRFLSPTGSSTLVRDVDLAELCITSAGTVRPGMVPEGAFTLPDLPGLPISAFGCRRRRASAASAAGASCPKSAQVPGHADLCHRCAEAVVRGAAVTRAASAG